MATLISFIADWATFRGSEDLKEAGESSLLVLKKEIIHLTSYIRSMCSYIATQHSYKIIFTIIFLRNAIYFVKFVKILSHQKKSHYGIYRLLTYHSLEIFRQ